MLCEVSDADNSVPLVLWQQRAQGELTQVGKTVEGGGKAPRAGDIAACVRSEAGCSRQRESLGRGKELWIRVAVKGTGSSSIWRAHRIGRWGGGRQEGPRARQRSFELSPQELCFSKLPGPQNHQGSSLERRFLGRTPA